MTRTAAYDTGALIAAEKNDRRIWMIHAALLEEALTPIVPSPVLAEAWRGGSRQANMSRLLKNCEVETFDEAAAKRVGEACGASGQDDIVDAAVVESATRNGGVVITSNRADIERIATALGAELQIEEI